MQENPTNPKPNPNLLTGGGFWEALVSAYVRADGSNRAALEYGFPTLRSEYERMMKRKEIQSC